MIFCPNCATYYDTTAHFCNYEFHANPRNPIMEDNKLTKLIEQYEAENPGYKAEYKLETGTHWRDGFVLWLVSRPTCGVEQRKFLDHIEKISLTESLGHPYIDTVWQDDTDADLYKVIKGE